MLVGEAATSPPGPAGGVAAAAGFREDLAAGAGAGAPAADDGGDGDAASRCGIECEATNNRLRGRPDAGRMLSDTTIPGTAPGYPGSAGASWSIGGRGDEGYGHRGCAASPEPFTDSAVAVADLSQAAFFGQLDAATARGAWAYADELLALAAPGRSGFGLARAACDRVGRAALAGPDRRGAAERDPARDGEAQGQAQEALRPAEPMGARIPHALRGRFCQTRSGRRCCRGRLQANPEGVRSAEARGTEARGASAQRPTGVWRGAGLVPGREGTLGRGARAFRVVRHAGGAVDHRLARETSCAPFSPPARQPVRAACFTALVVSRRSMLVFRSCLVVFARAMASPLQG